MPKIGYISLVPHLLLSSQQPWYISEHALLDAQIFLQPHYPNHCQVFTGVPTYRGILEYKIKIITSLLCKPSGASTKLLLIWLQSTALGLPCCPSLSSVGTLGFTTTNTEASGQTFGGCDFLLVPKLVKTYCHSGAHPNASSPPDPAVKYGAIMFYFVRNRYVAQMFNVQSETKFFIIVQPILMFNSLPSSGI